MSAPPSSESERIVDEYARRDREIGAGYYSLSEPANLFARHRQERAMIAALRRNGFAAMAGRSVLEVGCGGGAWFPLFLALGARPQDLAGIDLIGERIQKGRERYPAADLRHGDAVTLPWQDGAFDVVFQATMFTSVLDESTRSRVASEMLRVVKANGMILWLDFMFNNPKNPQVRGISVAEIRRLFPRCAVQARRIILAPPLARKIVPLSWTVATILESLRALNTHCCAALRPAEETGG